MSPFSLYYLNRSSILFFNNSEGIFWPKKYLPLLSSKNISQCKWEPLSFLSAPEEVPVLPDWPIISPYLTSLPATKPSVIEDKCE